MRFSQVHVRSLLLIACSLGSTNSNEAINISLVAPAPGGSRALASFNPQYSHALFGEEESIFGYKNLKINLKFNACDMRPNVQLTCQKKFKSVNETEAQDPILALKEFLPKGMSPLHRSTSEANARNL